MAYLFSCNDKALYMRSKISLLLAASINNRFLPPANGFISFKVFPEVYALSKPPSVIDIMQKKPLKYKITL